MLYNWDITISLCVMDTLTESPDSFCKPSSNSWAEALNSESQRNEHIGNSLL